MDRSRSSKRYYDHQDYDSDVIPRPKPRYTNGPAYHDSHRPPPPNITQKIPLCTLLCTINLDPNQFANLGVLCHGFCRFHEQKVQLIQISVHLIQISQNPSVFVTTSYRILSHDSKAVGVIGKSGSIIKAIRQHTGAWINVHELLPGDEETVIEIYDTRRRDHMDDACVLPGVVLDTY